MSLSGLIGQSSIYVVAKGLNVVRIFLLSDVVVLPAAQVKSNQTNSSKSKGCDSSLHQRYFLHPIKNFYLNKLAMKSVISQINYKRRGER